MKEDCYVDTSILVAYILEGRKDLFRNLSRYRLNISANVLEESTYQIIYQTICDQKGKGKKGMGRHDLKRAFMEKVGRTLIQDRIKALNEVADLCRILPLDDAIFELSKQLIDAYDLLSNDALISACCKSNGISKIATLDDDFSRVDFLEVVEL
jgi:predicted nucleic acid-binding protein